MLLLIFILLLFGVAAYIYLCSKVEELEKRIEALRERRTEGR